MTLVRYEDGSLEDDLICLVDARDKIGIYSQTHGIAIQLVVTVVGCGLKTINSSITLKVLFGISGQSITPRVILLYPVVLLFDLFYPCQESVIVGWVTSIDCHLPIVCLMK